MRRLCLLCVVLISACADPHEPDGHSDQAADEPTDDPSGGIGGIKSRKLEWTCHNSGTPDNSNFEVHLVHDGTKILDETVATFHVIENGAQRPDRAIGQTVFDVEPSKLSFLDSQELKFSLSLQDFSDVMSWRVVLQADPAGQNGAFFGVMMTTFQSSDGDDLLHPFSVALTCDVNVL